MSQLEKRVTVRKIRHSKKSVTVKKWVRIKNVGHIQENLSRLKISSQKSLQVRKIWQT